MADIYSILSDETLDKIAAGGDLYESMTDNELDAVIAMGQQEASPAPAAPAAASLTMPTTEGDLFPVEQTSDIEDTVPQYEQNRVGAKIGQIQNIISPEDAKSMSAMGAGTKGALRVQQQGGPTAYDDDGSISNWLGNMWNTIAYNSSGKVTAKSTNRHLQSILRGTVKVDGKEIPLTQLPDEALDDLADSAGWNGWKGWLFGLRSDDSVLQHWDRTTGANIKDPVARKAARIKYAQDVARGMVEQQESEKMAASVELENRPKHFGADVGAGFAETASYMAPYMIPHTYGIVAGLIEAGDRANELLSDAYEVDNEGNIRIKALRDSTGAAIAKGAARGVVAPLVERFGGDLAMGVLGKIPLVKSMGDKIVATTAGKAVDKWIKSMSRLGKYTGMQSMPAEMIEEFEDQVLDAGLGLNLREGEKVGTTALSRAGGAAKEFFTLDNLQELAESMILIQVLGGGAAYMNDRRITKHLDNLIANEAGIDPKDLAGFSLEEKQAAYRAFVEGLSEAEVSRRFNRGAEAINKLANSIREGRDWMDDFRDSAMRMMDEDGSSAAPAQPQDASPRMTKGDILTAAEAKQQEMEWEMLPPEKADEVAPGTIVVLPDGTKLMRQKRGVSKWGIVGAKKNSIALADSAAEKLLENGFRIFSKDKKGKQNETRANEAQPQSEQTQSVVPPAGETARPVEAGEASSEVGGEVASTETPITPPTSASTETEVNTPPTTAESAEGGSGAAESEEDGEDSVDIDYDPDLPPDSLEDESESSASVKDEILPLADLEEPLADEEEEVLSSEDLEKPTRETKVPKLLTLPDTQEKFDELTRRLHTPIAQGGVSEKSQKGKAVQAEIERMKKAGWKPSEAQPLPPTNRLRRADGTDPLADKTQTTTPTTAVEPVDNEITKTYNTETKTPPTSNNKGETTNEEPERTQEGSKDESTVQVTESGDDFSRLQEASQAMPDSERALYRTGRKSLDEDDLGRASSKRSKRRRGRIVDVLRKRVNASNGGSNLSGVKTLSTRKEGKVLEYFDFGRTDGQTFRDVFEVVRNYLPNGELADLHDNYGDDVKCYLSEDGLCGFAVEADGKLVSVFSLRPGSLKAMKNSILAAGATHLDAYASKNQDLAEIFSDVLGFKVASRMDYNMDYDHDNIAANHGNPDVVFMVKPEKNQVIEEKHYGKDDYEVAQYNQKYQAKRRSHEDKLRHNRIKRGLDALKDNSIANKDSVALKQILADIDYMRKGDDAKWFMALGLKDDSDILSLENTIQGKLNGNDIYALSQTAGNDWRKVNFERLESENANERDAAFRALAKAYISNLNAYNKAQASQEIDDGVKAELENRVKFLTSAISNMSESDRQKFNKLVDDAESDLANKGTAEYQEAIGDRDELTTSEGERSDEENDLGAGGSGVTVNKQFEETESATQSRSGNRDNGYISLEDGNVVWHNALGDVVKKVPANVLDVVGKNNAEVKSLVDNLRKGQTVYMSVKDVESSIERDRRFTEDKDYQAWLKKQKANDAERMRERYEQESAKIAAGIGRNFIGGMKVKVVDREYIPGVDGNADERKSIGEIYTGSAADYANRSREGGKDDGPSLKSIGTGEGAQAFGWGLYGSNRRGVAKSYARAGKNKLTRLEFDGKEWDENAGDWGVNSIMSSYLYANDPAFRNNGGDFATRLRRQAEIYRQQIDDIERNGKSDPEYMFLEKLRRAETMLSEAANDPKHTLDRIKEISPTANVYGQTFFTDRAPGDESHLLKWYEPVSDENLARVAEQKKKEGLKEPLDLELWQGVSNPIGERFYNHIVRMTGSPKSASEFLARAGIDGVKYPVGSYGGKGVKDGNVAGWNYVSFRDDNIRVDHKWTDGELRYLRDPNTIKVVGTWNRETNELKLFRGANASTLVHELGGHAAYQFAQEQAAQGDNMLLDKMNECINYALNNPKMKPLIEDIRSRYPEATEEVMRDEIFAALMERNSPIMQDLTKTLQGRAWYNRTWQAIKDAFRAMLTKMGLNKADLRGIDKMQPEEFMSWFDRTMADGKNLGVLAGMELGDRGDSTRKMQVGELGAYALGRTADRAKEMELAGTSRREIWDKTGWWKGRDGMWRFEIPDPAALKLTQDNIKALRQHIRDKGFVSMRLGNLKGMDDLLWAHPDLEDISFSIVPDKAVNGAEGYYDEASNKILISRRLLSDLKALNSTLVHEIQHAVQVREGFDRGASFDLDVFKNAETEEERLAIVNNYLNSAGETEARLTESRRNMTPEQRRATPPWEMYDVAEEEQSVGRENGGRSETRQLRSSTTIATSFMDDTRSRGEKLEEKLIDSTAPIKSIQKEIDNHARARGEEGVEEVVNADGSTDWRNSTDFIEAKDKENGHLERNLRELKTRYIDPAMEALAKAIRPGQERADLITDFNLYLQCKHAAARNRKIANDREELYTPDYSEGMGMVTLSDGRRVGLSENVANQILAKMSRKYGAKFRNFEDAAQSVYKMLEADLHNRHKSGLLSTEDWLKYMERRQGIMDWGTYIPLKTDLQDTEGEAYRTFTTSLKRNEFMKAKGRGELDIADSPFAAAVLQAEQGIRRSSRNVLANVEANLAAKMNGGFVKNGLTDFTKTETDSDGMPIYAEVVEGVDARHVGTDYEFAFSDGDKATASSGASLVANRPDIHLFKRDGKLYAIRYRVGNNGRGIDVAKAFSGENMGHWGDGLQWVPRITHWLSSMRTQYSPEFTVSNMLADNLEALQALVGRYGLWDGGKAFIKSLQFQFRNARDLWRYVKTGEARGRVKSAIDAGILTKGGVVSQGIDAETKELSADLDKFIRKQKRLSEMSSVDMAKSFGRNVVDYISMANSFAEYSTRIGIVSALEEYGVPRKDAIKFARDATVNFNRKGTAMPYINGLYMFANAAVQGAMRSVQSFRDDFSNAAKPSSGQLGHNKHKGELVGMLVAIGVAKAILDNALGDDDDREKEGGRNARNLTEYDRKHNVGVPIGGGRQLAPLRFRGPYAAIPYLAQTFTRYALGDIDEGDVGAILASELGAQATDLLGGNGITNSKGEVDGSLLMQSIAPTLIDPVVQWATGKDYKGDNRLRRKFDATMPASSNGKRSTPDVYKSIAQVINSLTGGNENRIGKLDIAPEDLQLIIEFLGGAPMRDINNVVSSVKNVGELASGGAPDKTLSQMPFVRRVVREYPDVTGRYYDAIEMYERDKMEYKKTTRLDERRELRKSKPYLSTANTQLDKMIEQVKELTHLENGEVKRGRKWVAPKIERSEAQKNAYRKRRLRLQAAVLKRLGE